MRAEGLWAFWGELARGWRPGRALQHARENAAETTASPGQRCAPGDLALSDGRPRERTAESTQQPTPRTGSSPNVSPKDILDMASWSSLRPGAERSRFPA